MCAHTRKTLLQGNQPLHRSSLAARRRPELPLALQRRSDSESPSSSSLRNARREATLTPPFHTAYHHGSRRPPRRRRHDAAPAAARAAAPSAPSCSAPLCFHGSGSAAVRRHAFGARSLRRLGSCLHTRGGSFAPIVERRAAAADSAFSVARDNSLRRRPGSGLPSAGQNNSLLSI